MNLLVGLPGLFAVFKTYTFPKLFHGPRVATAAPIPSRPAFAGSC
jgi:hypothetical protein